jgi:glucose-fructose oxidoreductase
MAPIRVAGINFEHFHMGDLLRMVHEHPGAELVGICDEQPERMQAAAANFAIPASRVFTDPHACLTATTPDLVILCPAAARHGEFVELVAPYGVHIIVEKPMAATLAEADRMLAAVAASGKQLAINWPLAWYPPHVTSKRLIDAGVIGDVIEVHYYDGNRGPLWHTADKLEQTPTTAMKAASWFYRAAQGGGSLLDYLGYGTTLGTWFMNGRAPLEVTAVVDSTAGLEVDEHSITIARYAHGLSKFETRWGTFTDPWTLQPQPKCGFVIVGSEGTICSYDYEPTIRVQTRANPAGEVLPVDVLKPPHQNPIQYMIDRIVSDRPVEGPLSPAICRIGQQIVDSAVLSARERRTIALVS